MAATSAIFCVCVCFGFLVSAVPVADISDRRFGRLSVAFIDAFLSECFFLRTCDAATAAAAAVAAAICTKSDLFVVTFARPDPRPALFQIGQ